MEEKYNEDENKRELEGIPEAESLVRTPTNHISSPIGNNHEFKEQEWELVPPDGGWGWLVLFGATLVNILIPGTIKSFGVLFVEFIEAFDTSPAVAAWIPALCYFLYSSLGPISSILSVKYSFKTVTIIGGTFAAVGMMLTYYAFSVSYLYISYGVMVGTGAGLAFPPTVYIVTSYFLKLRGLANGICISGSAIGSIILPPVLRLLLEQYGYRGAVLIMGAITLNVWVAAIFYHPVERHMIRVPKIKKDEEKMIMNDEKSYELEAIENNTNNSRPKFMIAGSDETPSPKLNNKTVEFYSLDNGFVRSASAAVVQNVERGSDDHRHRKISAPLKEENRNNSIANNMSASSSFYAIPPESRFSSTRLGRFNQRNPPKRSPSTSSFQYISTPYHGSTLAAIQPSEFASHLSLKSITNSLSPSCKKGKNKKDEKERNKFFDLTLLADPTYLVILISNSTNAIGYTNFIILLPAYAITLGFDKSLAAYCISIVSLLDLVGRIGGSALSDIELIPKTWYFIGGLALSGASLAILPAASSYKMLCVCCACFGLASGVYVGVTAVIMADMLGTERLTSSYGISLFVNGILQLIGPPICGVLFEHIKTYGPIFTSLGCVLLFGASLWGFIPLINRRKKQEAAREAAKQAAEMNLL